MKRGGGWKRGGKLKRGGWKREKLVHLPLFLLHNVGLVQDLTKCVEELGESSGEDCCILTDTFGGQTNTS